MSLKGHTNLAEIEQWLDLRWCNGVSPDKIVLGFSFYGRSFTMEDTKCTTLPNCRFPSAGFAGDCTLEAGILSYSEVQGHKSWLGSQVYYDEQYSVNWMVYGPDQWIQYDDDDDDEESFEARKRCIFSKCLTKLKLWWLDLDIQDHPTMTALFREEVMEKMPIKRSGLDAGEAGRLAFDLSAYTVGRKERSIITTKQTTLNSVSDRAVRTIRLYCSHPADSKRFRKTFYKGAEDTTIRLSPLVNEGPWARMIRMMPGSTLRLPAWAIPKRGLTACKNGIYVLNLDYNFHLIKRDDKPVNLRVDYTNILSYWDGIIDSRSKSRKLGKANNSEKVKKRASPSDIQIAQIHGVVAAEDAYQLGRRWFDTFVRRLDKLNKIIKTGGGVLKMGFSRAMTRYSGCLKCFNGQTTITAGLDITADFNMKMDAKYSY
ncbi:glycoside hydrolase family 18 protein [Bipolaris oryzae ATCC 44560]|uniref:chitinase n=1 Tax=Bipolaris oryzae ATCC 44560 TaxID=930090 RepID=W6YN70_COCMI|nr:glycoside hydrolase family 18 protein [Bipolaris oryzae ATCC 44560]EUC40752.1 glycoside hydrolase family 18 protein [Bipolaris oryzae ATCC 44560]